MHPIEEYQAHSGCSIQFSCDNNGDWVLGAVPLGRLSHLTSNPAHGGPVIIPISQITKVRPRGSQVSQPLSREPGFRPRPLLPALRRGKEGRAGERLGAALGRGCIGGGGGGGQGGGRGGVS